jgi:hypothetical protein
MVRGGSAQFVGSVDGFVEGITSDKSTDAFRIVSMSAWAIWHSLRIGKGSIGRNHVSEMPVIQTSA